MTAAREAARLLTLGFAIGVAFTSCSEPGSSAERPAVSGLDSLEWLTQLVLEETDDVVLVEPTVAIDPTGGFLIGDRQEAQARRYSMAGDLLWHFGRKGSGPGEFNSVTAVRRLPSDSVLVADYRGRVSVLSPAGDVLVRDVKLPLAVVEQMEVVNDTLVLLSGRSARGLDSARLHLWNIRTNEHVRSFFAPFASSVSPDAATYAGWTHFAVRDDTVAAIFSVVDTVYLFGLDGRLINSFPIPSQELRRVKPGSTYDRSRGASGVSAWLGSFDLIADVHWMDDGSLLVPYQQVVADSARSRRWHLLRVSALGDLLSEVRDVPMVHAVDGHTIWFQTPGTLLPNELSSARLTH